MEKPPQRQHHDPATSSTASTDLPDPATEPDPPITKPQLTKLHTVLNKIGITDRDDYLTLCEYILGYRVDSTKNLAKNEAHTLLDALDTWAKDEKYPIDDRINDILNTAALKQAAQEEPQ